MSLKMKFLVPPHFDHLKSDDNFFQCVFEFQD